MKTSVCYLCGKKLTPNQYKLRVLTHYLCSDCEQSIVDTAVDDKNYEWIKEKIKELLIG